ncbi:MAG TPA: glycosyltransferase family 4 protein [Candidatus Saccharimonadales bacterium]|nr:glycosyltransferase family 4 protein [Candidatus Saccharimonadales bacterium]
MKILMLGWELPPNNSGGLGVACYELCKSLAKKGADIEFVLPYKAEHNIGFMTVTAAHPQGVAEVLKSGIAYDSYKYIYSDGRTEWVDIHGQQRMYELAVDSMVRGSGREFDVVHAHDWLTFRAALRVKQYKGCPLVVHFHSVEADRAGHEYGGNPLVREIESLAVLMADQIIAVSEHTKRAIVREYNIPADKIAVVHNSINPNEMQMLDSDNSYKYLTAMRAQGYRVVTNVGRLTIQKGLPNLLRAAKEVIARVPKTIFLIVGSGEQYFELLQLSADLGIAKNVVFTGFQRGKHWRDSYGIADLFVMPSISEPFGLTALEAVGYGTPALVSKQSGVSEVMLNCLKVDFWDVAEMANKITAVMQNDSLRDELHKNAYHEFEKLSWDTSADKLFKVYDQHLQGVAA